MKKIFKAFLISFTAGAALIAAAACGKSHEHTYAIRWSSDETTHWHAAICEHGEEKSDVATHVFVTENGKTFCSVCKYGCMHEYEETVLAPTCETDGYTQYTCKFCGDSYTENPTKAGHAYEYTTETEPTSEQGGKVKGVCKNDETHTVEIDLPALNKQDYTVTERAASCEMDGRISYTYKLPVGSVTYSVSVPTTGHKYVNGICSVCRDNEDYKVSFSDENACIITEYSGFDSNVVIPATIRNRTVTAIGARAFAGRNTIESVTVPETVTTIYGGAFENCRNLKELRLETSSVSVHETALSGCSSLTTAVIPNYRSAIDALPKENLKEVTVFNGNVSSLPPSAFEGASKLERVTLPENLTTINGSAFKDCYNLMSITIPEGVTSIKDNAFLNCYKLAEIFNLSALSVTAGSGDNGGLGRYAKFISTQEGESAYRKTDDGFLYFCENGENYLFHYSGSDPSITLPASIGGGDYRIYPYAFYGRTDITGITLLGGVTEIGENAFRGCYRLVEIYNFSPLTVNRDTENGCVGYYAYAVHTAASAESAISTQGDFEFIYDNDAAEYRLLGYIGDDKQIVLPASYNGNTYGVGQYAFLNRTDLTRITIPESLHSLGAYAFRNCGAEIVFAGTPAVSHIDDYAFYGYAGTAITLPAGVTDIGSYAFADCAALKEISLPRTLNRVNGTAFYGCAALEKVYYAGTIAEWCSIAFGTDTSGNVPATYANPMRYAKNFYANGSKTAELTKITVPNNVTAIGAWQFTGFDSVTAVTLTSSVTAIGTGAFSGCTKLTSFSVPKNATLGERILEGCIALRTLSLPTAALKAEKANGYPAGYLFGENKTDGTYEVRQMIPGGITAYWVPLSLTEIVLTDASETVISGYAFMNCSHLESITIPKNIVLIETLAFFNCAALAHVHYKGTRDEWNAITKAANWAQNAGNYTVHCSDDN